MLMVLTVLVIMFTLILIFSLGLSSCSSTQSSTTTFAYPDADQLTSDIATPHISSSYTPPQLPQKKYSLPEKNLNFINPTGELKSDILQKNHFLHGLSQDTISSSNTTPACSDSSLNDSIDVSPHVSHSKFTLLPTDDVFMKPSERRHTVSSGSRLSHYDNFNSSGLFNSVGLFSAKNTHHYGAKQQTECLHLSGMYLSLVIIFPVEISFIFL